VSADGHVTADGRVSDDSLRVDRDSTAEPARLVTRLETQELLRTLGFLLDHDTFNEVFDDVDSDGDDALLLEEFITCVGMLKKSVLEVRALEESFTRFRSPCDGSRLRERMKRDELALQQKPPVKPSDEGDGATDEEHKIYAADLVAALGVTEEIAEEMIYIADLQQNQSITFTEFRQVVVNWD